MKSYNELIRKFDLYGNLALDEALSSLIFLFGGNFGKAIEDLGWLVP